MKCSSVGFRSGDWHADCRAFHFFPLKKSWACFCHCPSAVWCSLQWISKPLDKLERYCSILCFHHTYHPAALFSRLMINKYKETAIPVHARRWGGSLCIRSIFLLHTLLFPLPWYNLTFVLSINRILLQNGAGFKNFLSSFPFLRLTSSLHVVANLGVLGFLITWAPQCILSF